MSCSSVTHRCFGILPVGKSELLDLTSSESGSGSSDDDVLVIFDDVQMIEPGATGWGPPLKGEHAGACMEATAAHESTAMENVAPPCPRRLFPEHRRMILESSDRSAYSDTEESTPGRDDGDSHGDGHDPDPDHTPSDVSDSSESSSHWEGFQALQLAFIVAARRIGWDIDPTILDPPPLYNTAAGDEPA